MGWKEAKRREGGQLSFAGKLDAGSPSGGNVSECHLVAKGREKGTEVQKVQMGDSRLHREGP